MTLALNDKRSWHCNLVHLVLMLWIATAFWGCGSSRLMRCPTLYVDGASNPFTNVPGELQSSDIEVVFATDRLPLQESANEALSFGAGRSGHLHIGQCRVEVGENLTWNDLVEESLSKKRNDKTKLSIAEPDVVFRYPGTFWQAARIDDPSATYAEFTERRLLTRQRLHQYLQKRLERSSRKEVYIFIHGYNNSFNDAVRTIGNLWHFMGRQGVPIAYSWPAGSGGLTGYTTDSESGDFTVFHLKMFLEDLAADPDIHKINILAHSRGTDVTLSALRELTIAARASGQNPRESLKLGNVVLASPDIDMEVAAQRISSEQLPLSMGRLTIYLSRSDKALKLSSWLHQSWSRIGLLNVDSFTPEQLQALSYFENVDMIDSKVSTDFLGHSYFYENPSASSDLILLLRDNRDAGAESGRPLIPLADQLWRLEDGYPQAPIKHGKAPVSK